MDLLLNRYRFKTKSVNDYRPLIDMKNIKMPWWCSGESADGKYVTIVCYLPWDEYILKYWDDAYDVEMQEVHEILYTDRYPKPSWLGN